MSKSTNSNNDNNNQPPSTPRWVKISGVIIIVLILLVVAIRLFGNGSHGPSRHVLNGEPDEQSSPIGLTLTENQENGIKNFDECEQKSSGGRHG